VQNRSNTTPSPNHAGLIRLGGLAIIVAMAIHIILNVVLKQFPPENPTAAELQKYLSDEAGTWAIVHGFRYVAFALILLFAAGLFVKTCRTRPANTIGWGVMSLLQVIAGMLSGVFIVSILNEGQAVFLIDIASLAGLVWFASTGVHMLIRGENSR